MKQKLFGNAARNAQIQGVNSARVAYGRPLRRPH